IIKECLKQKLNNRADRLRKKNKKLKIVNSSMQILSSDNELEISHQHTKKNISSDKENSNLTLEHEMEYNINCQITDTIDESNSDTLEDCVSSTSSIYATAISNSYNIPNSNSYMKLTSDNNLNFAYNSCIISDFDSDNEKANKNTINLNFRDIVELCTSIKEAIDKISS
ncbi:2624_t:CDS:2, partial [Scutellospora calospora]